MPPLLDHVPVRRNAVALVVALVLMSVVTPLSTASPPQPGTEENNLTANESATLWSRDVDDYLSESEYRERYGGNRTLLHQLANGTDLTFTRPPATAATWTRSDFEDLEGGDAETSRYPSHATLDDGVYITDAHATVFAIHPSTRGHLASNRTPLYIAPNGSLRGFVDYRIRIPNTSTQENTTVEWSLVEHEVREVRLKADGEVINRTNRTQTPRFDYRLAGDGNTTLTIEAEIHTHLEKTTRTEADNSTNTTITNRSETLNVSDSVDVEIYDLTAYPYYARYPDGDAGVAIFQTRPWQGYTLDENNTTRVRGVWRFYTARNPNWDTVVRSTQGGQTTVASDAIPVYVHAYPSRIGPRAEPVRTGPDILDTWGPSRPSPAATIGENVSVEVVNQSYAATAGVAVRTGAVDRDALHVTGIVRGVNATIVNSTNGSERQLRRSDLSLTVLERTETEATLRIELQDSKTGAPIGLNESGRWQPIGGSAQTGYITVAGQQVKTNDSGVAIVTVDQPGLYTARYHPGSWLRNDPAYVSDTATTRWHPLGTIDGWFAFLVEVGWQLLPFFVMLYAGRCLLRLLGPEEVFDSNP